MTLSSLAKITINPEEYFTERVNAYCELVNRLDDLDVNGWMSLPEIERAYISAALSPLFKTYMGKYND